ncbi:MAG TPA: hypothetical protein VD761_11485 [Solirubrobacterales bacterium]|nr:hypothetical protein [Solirubrobacterales bacterium]
MSASDVAGIFSRYFIVGFFLPAFFALVGLSQALSDPFLPSGYRALGGGTQIAVLGATGVLLGLLLLGLNWQVIRLYEGYPLVESRRRIPLVGKLRTFLIGRQERAFRTLEEMRDGEDESRSAFAAWKLDTGYPDRIEALMPTRFGNAVLAFEAYAMKRWGLDSVPAWPRIDMLLSERQAELEANARSQVCFFVNGSLLLLIAGAWLVVDEIVEGPLSGPVMVVYLLPFLASVLLARWATGAATRWGSTVRAAIDLHRFELYEKLGVRHPRNFSDERRIAAEVNQALLYGRTIPDELSAIGHREDKGDAL